MLNTEPSPVKGLINFPVAQRNGIVPSLTVIAGIEDHTTGTAVLPVPQVAPVVPLRASPRIL